MRNLRRLLRSAGAAGALTIAALPFASGAAAVTAMPGGAAQAGDVQTVTVGDAAEAWYTAAPADTCGAPVGCLPSPVPSSPYPPDTLHVGYAAGQETARTYVAPAFTTLVPFGATMVSGAMTLPVATDTGAGTTAPDSAHLTACLAVAPITDGVQGATSKPPAIDCGISQPASYDAKSSAFTLDLAPFITAWNRGESMNGLALIPDPVRSQPTDAWHVALNGRARQGFPHITTTVGFTLPGTSSTPQPTATVAPPVPPQPSSAVVAIGPLGAPGLVQAPPAPASGAGNVAPQIAPTPPPSSVVAQPAAYAYRVHTSMAFIAPLLLLAFGVFLSRLFTRDATPVRLP